jgi:16S rRNA (cytidine1402-2'-O)-methyltransferase
MASNSGVLYVVATPIGNLGDISQRAIEVLNQVDVVAAEDTRHAQKLLNHLGLKKHCISYHQHNEAQQVSTLIDQLRSGQSIALISDAGTPLISDPGYPLVRDLRAQNVEVVPIPGPSAVITALSVAGLPTDKFIFEGFLPAKSNARKQAIEALANEPRTVVWYESCHRIEACLNDMQSILGPRRIVTICRELTKRFETIHQARLDELCDWIKESNQQKGEFVLVVEGHDSQLDDNTVIARQQLKILLDYLPPSQAAAAVAQLTGVKKKWLYQQALAWREE